jgi:hypothetical protein
MSDIIRLPVELFVHIRSWLYHNIDIGGFAESDDLYDIDRFLLYEAHWSWNNFLSVCNCEDWKVIRKKTMIWSLNADISLSYIENNGFRSSINNRVELPHQQIECRINYQNSRKLRCSEVLQGNILGYLSIQFCCLEVFPSCNSLHTLVLAECDNLKEMGDYKQLRTLKLIDWVSLLRWVALQCYPVFLQRNSQKYSFQSCL